MSLKRIRGIAALRAGRMEEGKSILRRCVAKGDVSAALTLSEVLTEEEEELEAVEILRSVVGVDPKATALPIADIYSEMNGFEKEAEHYYRLAMEAGSEGAANNYGCFLSMNDDRTEDAERLFLEAIESGDDLAPGNLGKMYLDGEEYDRALPLLKKSVESGDRGILPYLARAELEIGDQKSAWAHIVESMKDEDTQSALVCALYLEKYGDYHPEMDIEEMFRESLPEGGIAHFHFANWLRSEGRPDEAESEYGKAIEEGETNAHLNLALLLDDMGRRDDAEQSLRSAVSTGDATAAENLARFLADDGRASEIPSVIRKAEELGSTKEEVRDLWALYHLLQAEAHEGKDD
ncbi:hypothetical protein OHA63_13105 [Streptomyces anulatus]|uniref:tetratricopeptide repeat protein n=1 Tax=Streptomyces anulatus TaxID=1892 RepID=UPI002E343370|nr:tetratricopeptide repeat protein [Streptomyces anulatus]